MFFKRKQTLAGKCIAVVAAAVVVVDVVDVAPFQLQPVNIIDEC